MLGCVVIAMSLSCCCVLTEFFGLQYVVFNTNFIMSRSRDSKRDYTCLKTTTQIKVAVSLIFGT